MRINYEKNYWTWKNKLKKRRQGNRRDIIKASMGSKLSWEVIERFLDAKRMYRYRRAGEKIASRMENPRLVSFHGIYVKRARQELCIPTTFGLIKFKTSNRGKTWHNMESGEMSLSDEEEIFNQVEAYITHTLKWSMGRTTDRVEKLKHCDAVDTKEAYIPPRLLPGQGFKARPI